jgi:hypothetical protein
MPFVSKQQLRLCYALKRSGKNKGWDCDEWLSQTDVSSLPNYAPTSSLRKSRSRSPSLSRSRSPSLSRSRSKSKTKTKTKSRSRSKSQSLKRSKRRSRH